MNIIHFLLARSLQPAPVRELFLKLAKQVNIDFCELIGFYNTCLNRETDAVEIDILSNKLEDLVKLLIDPYTNIDPTLACTKDEAGIAEAVPAVLQDMQSNTAGLIYQGVRTAFNQEMNEFPMSFSEEIVPTEPPSLEELGIDPDSPIAKAMDPGTTDDPAPSNAFNSLRFELGNMSVSPSFRKGLQDKENFFLEDTPDSVLCS